MLNKYFMVIVFLVLYVLYKTLHKSEHFSENNNKLKLIAKILTSIHMKSKY